MADKPTTNYLVDAWLILVLAVVFGGGLAGVHIGLNPMIEKNKRDKSFTQIPTLVPGSSQTASEIVMLDEETLVYAAKDDGGKQVGWVVPASGQGFADVIELLIGVDTQVTKVTGLFVLKNNETPGLGNKIDLATWRAQFNGKVATEPITVVKRDAAGQQVNAVTGATISSDSVVAIVNRALAEMGPRLREQAGAKE